MHSIDSVARMKLLTQRSTSIRVRSMLEQEFSERSFGKLSFVFHPKVGLRDYRGKQWRVSSKTFHVYLGMRIGMHPLSEQPPGDFDFSIVCTHME